MFINYCLRLKRHSPSIVEHFEDVNAPCFQCSRVLLVNNSKLTDKAFTCPIPKLDIKGNSRLMLPSLLFFYSDVLSFCCGC